MYASTGTVVVHRASREAIYGSSTLYIPHIVLPEAIPVAGRRAQTRTKLHCALCTTPNTPYALCTATTPFYDVMSQDQGCFFQAPAYKKGHRRLNSTVVDAPAGSPKLHTPGHWS